MRVRFPPPAQILSLNESFFEEDISNKEFVESELKKILRGTQSEFSISSSDDNYFSIEIDIGGGRTSININFSESYIYLSWFEAYIKGARYGTKLIDIVTNLSKRLNLKFFDVKFQNYRAFYVFREQSKFTQGYQDDEFSRHKTFELDTINQINFIQYQNVPLRILID